VLEQEGNDFEVVVVDDGSTDGSPGIIEEFVLRQPETIVSCRQENCGPAAARNQGIRIARGEYLCFLDADDELTRQALSVLRPYVDHHPRDFLVGAHISIEGNGLERFRPAPGIPSDREVAFRRYLDKRIGLSNGATFFHRRVFEAFCFPENLRQMEDVPVFALTMALYSGVSVPQALVRIYKHPDSLRHDWTRLEESGLGVVDVLFGHPALPPAFQKYKGRFLARRAMSMFRRCYDARQYKKGEAYFLLALKTRPWDMFMGGYLLRYLKMRMGRAIGFLNRP